MPLPELKAALEKAVVSDAAGTQLLSKPELRTLILKETKEGE